MRGKALAGGRASVFQMCPLQLFETGKKKHLKNKGKLVLNRFLLSGITDVVLYRLQYSKMAMTQAGTVYFNLRSL